MATSDELQIAFEDSCRSYWTMRDQQALTGGGEGLAAAVRAGRHFGSLEDLVTSVFVECGYGEGNFLRNSSATVPGWYRVTKNWDLIVHDEGILVAALELKGLGAQSAGNNFNNRTEEAIGNATDLGLVHERTGAFGDIPPWCGFMFLMEEAPRTRAPIIHRPSPWAVGEEFEGSSYCDRGAILSRRMLEEGLYDAVCFVTSTNDPSVPPREPDPLLSWLTFVSAIQSRVAYVERSKRFGPCL